MGKILELSNNYFFYVSLEDIYSESIHIFFLGGPSSVTTISSPRWRTWRYGCLLLIDRQTVRATAILNITSSARHLAVALGRDSRRRRQRIAAVALPPILCPKVLVVLAKRCAHLVRHLVVRSGRVRQRPRIVALGLAPDQRVVAHQRRLLGRAAVDGRVHVQLEAVARAAVLELVAAARHVAVVEGRGLAVVGEVAAAVALGAVLSAEVAVARAKGGALLVGHVRRRGACAVREGAVRGALGPAADQGVGADGGLVGECASGRGDAGRRLVELEPVAGATVLSGIATARHIALLDWRSCGSCSEAVAAVACSRVNTNSLFLEVPSRLELTLAAVFGAPVVVTAAECHALLIRH